MVDSNSSPKQIALEIQGCAEDTANEWNGTRLEGYIIYIFSFMARLIFYLLYKKAVENDDDMNWIIRGDWSLL